MRTRLLALAAGLASACTAAAQPLIDNLAEPERDRTVIFRDPAKSLWAAQTFITDTQGRTLDSIETFLGDLTGTPTIIAELREGPDPTGPVVAVFAPTIPAGALETVTLTPLAAATLLASTSYTLVLGVADEGSFTWPYADTNAWTGPGSFSNYHYSTDAGAQWSNFGGKFPYFLRVNAEPIPCYPNCDGSTAEPVLNALDFSCFLSRYRAGEGYANCDGSTAVPELNALDFGCFLTRYRAGCP